MAVMEKFYKDDDDKIWCYIHENHWIPDKDFTKCITNIICKLNKFILIDGFDKEMPIRTFENLSIVFHTTYDESTKIWDYQIIRLPDDVHNELDLSSFKNGFQGFKFTGTMLMHTEMTKIDLDTFLDHKLLPILYNLNETEQNNKVLMLTYSKSGMTFTNGNDDPLDGALYMEKLRERNF